MAACGGLGLPPALSARLLPQVLTRQQQEQAALHNYNFDHPDAFDFDLIVSTLQKLKQGKSVKVPVYDFTTHSRKKDWVGPAAGLGGDWAHGRAQAPAQAPSLCRRRSTVPTSLSSRASWPLLTRHCWRCGRAPGHPPARTPSHKTRRKGLLWAGLSLTCPWHRVTCPIQYVVPGCQ